MGKQNKKSPIKPCPFCGSIPEVDTHTWKHFEHQKEPFEVVEQRVIIKCPECFCTKDIVHTAYAELGLDEKKYRKLAKLLARYAIDSLWNRRYKHGVF